MKKRILLTFISIVAAIICCSGVSFASQAVVDDYFGEYTHPQKFKNCLIIDGIDVSYWQKDIDWEKVKRQGIDYALIRIGYTGLDSPFSRNADSYFEQNYRQARNAGIMVGTYYYSCATTMKEAQNEAQYVLDILDGRHLDLPVVFDFEYAGRIKKKYEGKTATTSNILAFLNYIQENSAYEPMFYSYRNIMDPDWSPKFHMHMIDDKYKVWIAQYSLDISYSRPFTFWQYANDGSINGIDGRVDCNFWYYDNDTETTLEGTSSIKNAKVSVIRRHHAYTANPITPSVTVFHQGRRLTEGEDYQLNYIKNVLKGTGYILVKGIGNYSNVKMVPFYIHSASFTQKKPNFTGATTYTKSLESTSFSLDLTTDSNGKITYATSNPKIALVSETGQVTLQGKTGTVNLTMRTAETKQYRAASQKITLHVTANVEELTKKIKNTTISLTTEADYGYIQLDWTKSKGPAVDYFEIYRSTSKNQFGTVPYYTTKTGYARSFNNHAKLIKGKHYYYKIRGVKVVDGKKYYTKWSNQGSRYYKYTGTADIQILKGVKATKLTGSSSQGRGYIKIKWKKDSKYKVDYYQVYRSKKKNGDYTLYKKTASGRVTNFTDKKYLTKGTTYYYKIRGVRTVDGKKYFTKWSAPIAKKYTYISTADLTIVNGVKKTKITASSSSHKGYIKIKWKKNSKYKISYYQIYRSKSKESGYKHFYNTESGKNLSYKNTTLLKKGTKYYYKVRGVRIIDGKKYYTKWSNVASRIAK